MITDLKPYPNMKESGLPWLGQVPEHWDLRRMKVCFRERISRGFPTEPLLAATQTKGVVRKERYASRTVVASKDLHLLKLVLPGDFVISLRSFQGGIEYARDRGIISPAYTVLYPTEPDMHGYFAWLFKSPPFIRKLSLYVGGIRQGQNIDYDKLARAGLPVPSVSERVAIARFLDHAGLRIQRYVWAKRRLITLLEEQRRVVVRRAVTAGIDSSVPTRPTGIPWLGEIPAHWAVRPAKTLFTCLNARRRPLSSTQRGEMTSHAYDYYGASGVIDKVDEYLFDEDLVLIAEDGANLVLRNLPLALVARGYYWVNNHAHILRPIAGDIDFLAARLEAMDFRPWITGAAQPKLTKDRLMSIALSVPEPAEQQEIMAHVRAETDGLVRSLSAVRRELELMLEYRKRLVADVVTGKLDVRDAAARLPAETGQLDGGDAEYLEGEDESGVELEEVEA